MPAFEVSYSIFGSTIIEASSKAEAREIFEEDLSVYTGVDGDEIDGFNVDEIEVVEEL